MQLTVDSGYVADRDLAADNIMNVSYLPYSPDDSSVRGSGRKNRTIPADSSTKRTVIYDEIQWRQDIELVNSKDTTTLHPYNKFTVSNEGKVKEDDQYIAVSSSGSTLRERKDDKKDAKDTFVFCSDNLSFKFPEGFKITDKLDEVKDNVYLYKDVVKIFSNANISFTFSVSL